MNPIIHEAENIQPLQEAYMNVFAPGIDMALLTDTQQPNTSPVTITSLIDRSMVTDPPSNLTNRSMITESPPSHANRGMMTEEQEDLPRLGSSLEEIQEINKMKNVILYQLLHDNISLHESQLNSRKRALQLLENEFNISAEELAQCADESITEQLNRILHVKNRFLTQLMKENVERQPQIMQAARSLY